MLLKSNSQEAKQLKCPLREKMDKQNVGCTQRNSNTCHSSLSYLGTHISLGIPCLVPRSSIPASFTVQSDTDDKLWASLAGLLIPWKLWCSRAWLPWKWHVKQILASYEGEGPGTPNHQRATWWWISQYSFWGLCEEKSIWLWVIIHAGLFLLSKSARRTH